MAPCDAAGVPAPRDARLLGMRLVAADALLLELEVVDGAPLPAAAPGAHIDLYLPDRLTRQYSVLTSFSSSRTYAIAVKREAQGRGASRWLHDQVRPGARLGIGAPRNHFPLNENAGSSVLFAGGIGITPIYSMFHRLQALGRAVHLHYWCRSRDHALFLDQLEGTPQVTLHYPRAGTTARRVSEILSETGEDVELYCCGPDRMLADFEHATRHRLPAAVHIERFGGPAPERATAPFTVALARSGSEVKVNAGETILEALIAAAVDVPYSCEQGVCGACETKVLAGTPVHRDSLRSAADHDRLGTVMICCASCDSERLVLDL